MKDSTSDGEMLTVFDLVQYYYCPRKVYFLQVLRVPVVPKRKMIYGQREQEEERKRVKERKDVFGIPRDDVEKIIRKMYIEDLKIRLCGQIDYVLKLKNGTIIPVDVKYTDFVTVHRNWKKQMTAYALLLESEFNCKVDKGVFYFPQQKESVFLEITSDDKRFVIIDLERIRELIRSERIPRKVSEKKCEYCEVRRYCV